MKVVILAGGLGTRISEEVGSKPKPMIEVGGRPIIWHVMKHYSHYGHNEFIICLGYKGYVIKEYFANYFMHMSDVTFHLAENRMEVHGQTTEPWKVTLVDTGEQSMTGGRLKRVLHHVGGRRGVRLHLWRRGGQHRSRRPARLSSAARKAGDGDRSAPPQPLRRPDAGGRRGDGLSERNPDDEGGLDQRRLLPTVAQGRWTADRRTTRPNGSASRWRAWRRR